MKRDIVFIGVVGAIAFIFRIWIATGVPQPFIFDQLDYDWFAQKILTDPLMIASHSFRTYPYPLFLAVLYKLTGFANHSAVTFIQALMDSGTAVLVYLILWTGFRKKSLARLGMILYALNPFTAGYVNVILAEVLTTFFLAGTVAAGSLFIRRPGYLLAFLFGLCAGITAEARNAAFVWALIPIGGAVVWVRPWMRNIGYYVVLCIGLVLAVLYPLVSNFRDYHEVNFTTVDDFYAKEFYNGVIITTLPDLAMRLPVETYRMYAEYYSEYNSERNTAYRQAIQKKYFAKALEIISRDPWEYIRIRFSKMWYVWQKQAIHPYWEPGYEAHWIYMYIVNLVGLGFAVCGILWYFLTKSAHDHVQRWLLWTIIGTVLYGTLAFSLTHAEHRLTIPFYPVLAVSAAIGLGWLTKRRM